MESPLLGWPHRKIKTEQVKSVLRERDCLKNPKEKSDLLKGQWMENNFSVLPLQDNLRLKSETLTLSDPPQHH